MKCLNIDFVDFWPGFDKHDNYFSRILSNHYSLAISNDPDIVMCSVFGNEHRKFRCKVVQFIGENIRPNACEADYFMSFDFPGDENSIRWPLYNLYYDPKAIRPCYDNRTKFCCMVTSNPGCAFRNEFFHRLSERKPVDSGGRYLNNVGGPVPDKRAFLSMYKFSLAFENSSYPGYTTEKLLEAKLSGTVPIYWGNPRIACDVNEDSFINVQGFNTVSDCIDFILKVDADDSAYSRIRNAPLLKGGEYTGYSDTDKLVEWLVGVIEGRSKKRIPLRPILSPLIAWRNSIVTRRYNRLALAKIR